jgi:uncharacterized cofD-like protein
MQISDFVLGLAIGGVAMLIPRLLARGENPVQVEEPQAWETLYQSYIRDNGPRIAAIGGGTGLSNLLRGLKNYSSNLSAIVNVTDDGGSSGRLRENLAMLPPGDIRNCLLALANTEPLLEKVFQHRFSSGDGLEGHSMGNLFLAALTEEFGFEEALAVASRVLAVKGEVMPVTLENVNLTAYFADGSVVRGESRIPRHKGKIEKLTLEPDTPMIFPAAEQAIREADIVVVGPGSLYTSVLANLIIPGVAQALRETKARKIYIGNVMTQPGETDGYTAADHVQAIYNHVAGHIFDVVIINNNLQIPPGLATQYAVEGACPVLPDKERLAGMGVEVLETNLLDVDGQVLHNRDKLARLIVSQAIQSGKRKNKRKRKLFNQQERKGGAR